MIGSDGGYGKSEREIANAVIQMRFPSPNLSLYISIILYRIERGFIFSCHVFLVFFTAKKCKNLFADHTVLMKHVNKLAELPAVKIWQRRCVAFFYIIVFVDEL